jgi:mono/diheme cytochrome c family protein
MLRLATPFVAAAATAALFVAVPPDAPRRDVRPAAASVSALEPPTDPRKLPGWSAYVKHCSACHGEEGDGKGVGARFLDPPPRDFGFGRFRFVSTENGAPSGKDLFETIGAGLAGTSMLPFAHLGEDAVWALVDVVQAFRARPIKKRLVAAGKEGAELAAELTRLTTPVLPPDPAAEPPETYESAARGLLHFRAHCAKCHAPDATGRDAPPMKAEEGHDTPPPDLTQGVFRQSPLKKNWFARIRLGLPGSAMPAIPKETLDDRGVWETVHYLRTLSGAGAQLVADAAARDLPALPLEGPPPTTPDDPRFLAAPQVWIPFVPFRARERTTPGLFVQALHHDDTLFFRAIYPDPTENGDSAPDPKRRTPPDGIAVRITSVPQPPVLPYPGQIPPIDRALSLRGSMPRRDDPLFDALPSFANPERVCRTVLAPDRAGDGVYRGGAWHVLIGVRGLEAGPPKKNRVSASFAAFDGELRRGPMPTAFTHWSEIDAR